MSNFQWYEFKCKECNQVKNKKNDASGYKKGDFKKKFNLCKMCNILFEIKKKYGEDIDSKRCSICNNKFLQKYGGDSFNVGKVYISIFGMEGVCEECIFRNPMVYLFYSQKENKYKFGQTRNGYRERISYARNPRVNYSSDDYIVVETYSTLQHVGLERRLRDFFIQRGYKIYNKDFLTGEAKELFKQESFNEICKKLLKKMV